MSARLQLFSMAYIGLALSLSLGAQAQVGPVGAPSGASSSEGAEAVSRESASDTERSGQPADVDLDANAPASIDDRFTTEGYLGLFGAGLQNSIPSLGFTASIYLDDDFRAGIDVWRGNSSSFFGSFKSQGAGLWTAHEMADSLWVKGGLSYSRLERPTAQQPLAALMGGKESSDRRASRTDCMQVDVGFGQLWSFSHFSVAADYVGFSVPFMILTGPKPSAFSLNALRVEMLYDIE